MGESTKIVHYDFGNGPMSGDGGGGDHMLEARVAKLEATAEHIDKTLEGVQIDMRELRRQVTENLKITVGALIFVALGLAGLMARGFGWV